MATEDEDMIEEVEGMGDESPEPVAPPRPKKPSQVAVAPDLTARAAHQNPQRNLTHEAILASLESKKAEALSKIPDDEVVECALPKLDRHGKIVKGPDGFTIIENRKVLRRDKVSADWDKHIATMQQTLG